MTESQPQSIGNSDHINRLMWNIVAVLVLSFVHYCYCSAVGLEIFRRRGGFTDIGGGWIAIGGVEHSWTPVVWLPAGVFFYFGEKPYLAALGGIGFWLLCFGSIATAVYSVRAIRALTSSSGREFGHCAWKLWLPVLLWAAWVPVTILMTWTYQHTVRY